MSDDPSALARRLNDNRNRVLAGETIDPDEYRELIEDLRRQRLTTPSAAPRPRKGADAPPPEAL